MTENEKKPLLPAESQASVPVPTEHAFALPMSPAREWKGHLLACFGNGDQLGVSSYAYVKLLSPLAWGHNMQRAFNWSFWKHALVFMLLFSIWGYTFLGAYSRVAVECGPHPPHPPHDKHHPEPRPEPKLPGPKEQQFLAGATFNPAFAAEKEDLVQPWESQTGAAGDQMVSLDAMENPALQTTQINSQILEAKNQAANSMAQLSVGRKLLHKHDHDDEDEQRKAERKAAKKEKKLQDKLRKEAEEGRDHDDDDDDEHDHHHEHEHRHHEHGPDTPACYEATRNLGIWALAMVVSSIFGIIYAVRARTAMRTKFGIPGSRCRDAAAWTFCGPCALCQETRTLAHNNVHEGVWFGETVLATPAGHPFMPAVQQPAPTKA
jgi:Cys-rich protein (TIGR01571 family)